MGAIPWHAMLTAENFLEWEEAQEDRFEFVNGVIRGMVGGTADHSRIVLNLRLLLHRGLHHRGCTAFAESTKLRAPEGHFLYPDVLVVCRPVAGTASVVTDPIVVAEVLSRSTRAYSRGEKAELYAGIPSIQVYLLVEQDRRHVELRRSSDWRPETVIGDAIQLPELGLTLPLDHVYGDVALLQFGPQVP